MNVRLHPVETDLDDIPKEHEPWSPRETIFQPMFNEQNTVQKICKNIDKKVIIHDAYVIPGTNNQDWVKAFETSKNNPAVVVLDGHGKGDILRLLKENVRWHNIMDNPNPVKQLQKMISTVIKNPIKDGSTFASVESMPSGFRCRWLGDTQIVIYHNEKEVWRSTNHTCENPQEKLRLQQMGVPILHRHTLHAIDDKHMTMVDSGMCVWKINSNGDPIDQCSPTRVLGHTGHASTSECDYRFIKYNNSGRWRAVVYTDGVGDVVHDKNIESFGKNNITSFDIATNVLHKWNQPWNYVYPEAYSKGCSSQDAQEYGVTTLRSNIDDIGVAIIDVNVTIQ